MTTRPLQLTTRRLQRVKARVNLELSRNVLWRTVAADRFWICPYCGMVGANVHEGVDRTDAVTYHLLRQCTHFAEFDGSYVSTDLLRARALEVLVGWKTTHDVAWRFLDDRGRWFCPYCARPQPVPGLRTEEAFRELKATAIRHLRECAAFAEGRGEARGPDEISREVQLETLAHRLADPIRHAMAVEPAWRRHTSSGHAICPYCLHELPDVDESTPFLARGAAPEGLARHLVRSCEACRAIGRPEDQPSRSLPPLPPAAPLEEPQVPVHSESRPRPTKRITP